MSKRAKPQMAKMPWFPSNFYASTRTWPFMPRAIYRELLDIAWEEGGLPADPERLRQILGVDAAMWQEAWPLVATKFEQDKDGQLRNQRLEAHRQQAIRISQTRRNAANTRHGNVVHLNNGKGK